MKVIKTLCISISYKKADTPIRAELALQNEQKIAFLKNMTAEKSSGYVILCTCNRTEVYFENPCDYDKIECFFSEISGLPSEQLKKYIFRYCDDSALFHLFSLACGLDSIVIGEDEILRQLKEAYIMSADTGTLSSSFNMIFQAAFACAKKVKTRTLLSKTPVSIASLSANYAIDFCGDKPSAVMIIGASGHTGSAVLKNIMCHKNLYIYVTVRKHNHTINIIPHSDNIKIIDYSDRYDYIPICDCIISATSSPHYTITYDDIKPFPDSKKKRLFIDLAVPLDISPQINLLENAELINIDKFKQISADNNKLKRQSAAVAEDIIKEDIMQLKKNLLFKDFIPKLNQLENMDIKKIIYALKNQLDYQHLKPIIDILSEIEPPKEN